MRWLLCITIVVLLSGSIEKLIAQNHLIAKTEPLSPAEERKKFRLPQGFEAQLVASEPDIRKPLNLAFDAKGRLWVTDTIEYPLAAKDPAQARDRVVILSDFGPDGKARSIVPFADNLNIPIGVLPLPNARDALVYGIPELRLMRDTKDTGKCNERKVLYRTFGHLDTHGMVNSLHLGLDGWVYCCHGFRNDSKIAGSDGSTLELNSGNTFRVRPDGSRVEAFTRGQVNPFGLCFDPLGNLYSADCHSRPLTQLLRGGHYSSFSKSHDGLGYAPEMMGHDHGSTGLCGPAFYAANAFPEAYHNTMFVCNVVTSRINHDRIEYNGSSPRAVLQPDFLISDDPWFRPVDIKLGPDGALYVADFYNRIIAHYEVDLKHPGRDRERGRIWRIVYTGQQAAPTTPSRNDWTRASVAELIDDLAHANLTVRTLATQQLAERGAEVEKATREAFDKPRNAFQKLHALWVLERLGKADEATLQTAAKDKEAAVRVHTMRLLAERAKWSDALRTLAINGLKDDDALTRRCAADALGMHPAAAHVEPLLMARRAVPKQDPSLLHVIRMALRNQFRDDPTAWKARKWSAEDLAAIADVAVAVPMAESAAFLVTFLKSNPSAGLAENAFRHAARYGDDSVAAELLTIARASKSNEATALAQYRALFQGTQQRGSKPSDDLQSWGGEVVIRAMTSPNAHLAVEAIRLSGTARLTSARPTLEKLIDDKTRSDAIIIESLNALTFLDPTSASPALGKALANANATEGVRSRAAQLLATIPQKSAREELVKALPLASARVAGEIALGLSGSREGAEALLELVTSGKATPRLLQERGVVLKLKEQKLPDLDVRLAKLTAGLPSADAKLANLFKQRRESYLKAKPDTVLGQKVFTKHCANCHQIANQGAKLGPQLDGIGIRGVDRLLEDILDPNRNVDHAFRSTTLVLKNGQVLKGLIVREIGQVVIIADAQGKEQEVRKDAIEERSISPLSPMPANFDQTIPAEDFNHLMRYLLDQRVK